MGKRNVNATVFKRYISELIWNDEYLLVGSTTPMGCFLYYDEVIEEVSKGLHPEFSVVGNTLYHRNRENGELKIILRSQVFLATATFYHLEDKVHYTTDLTFEKMEEDFALVPKEIVRKVVWFCGCERKVLKPDSPPPYELPRIKESIEVHYLNYLNELRSNASEERLEFITAMDCFISYKKNVAHLEVMGPRRQLTVKDNTLYFRQGSEFKFQRVLRPEEMLDEVLKHHTAKGKHKPPSTTIAHMRESSISLIPEEVVAKIISFCSCRAYLRIADKIREAYSHYVEGIQVCRPITNMENLTALGSFSNYDKIFQFVSTGTMPGLRVQRDLFYFEEFGTQKGTVLSPEKFLNSALQNHIYLGYHRTVKETMDVMNTKFKLVPLAVVMKVIKLCDGCNY